jgi:hypothetical protein
MKTLIIIAALSAVCIAWGQQSDAPEFRVWKDSAGKTIEAVHVRTLSDKVILRQQDGEELTVSLDTLSEKDRRYAILLAPPRIEIDVAIDVDRENKAIGRNYGPGVQIQKENISAKVSLKKSSSPAYEAPLLSEIWLIGRPEQNEAYVILGQKTSKFRFTTENSNEHVYESGQISLKQIEMGKETGVEYGGYLAIVKDRNGDVLSTKSNKQEFERNAEAIIGSSKGDVFDEDFQLVDRKEVNKVVEKRTKQVKRRMPGRRF